MDTILVRPFELQDEKYVFGLSQRMLGEIWPMDLSTFQTVLFENKSTDIYFVAILNDEIIGFIATSLSKDKSSAQISIILVSNDQLFEKVANQLLSTTLTKIKNSGTDIVFFGSGVGKNYFWPGIPDSLPSLVLFFKNAHWNFFEESIDMVRVLKDYETPDFVYERIDQLGIKVDFIELSLVPKLLDFEKKNFPEWLDYFESTVKKGKFKEILVAQTVSGEIVGSVLVRREENFKWNQLLGGNVGTIGALGVSEKMRGKGLGLALVAKATETLQAQQIEICYIGWTWLTDWYGKLGYHVWRKYQRVSKTLGNS